MARNLPLFDLAERNAPLLQALQMTSIGMAHMLLLAYERIDELEEQVQELERKLEVHDGTHS